MRGKPGRRVPLFAVRGAAGGWILKRVNLGDQPDRELWLTLTAMHAEAMARWRAARYAARLMGEPLLRSQWLACAAEAAHRCGQVEHVMAAAARMGPPAKPPGPARWRPGDSPPDGN